MTGASHKGNGLLSRDQVIAILRIHISTVGGITHFAEAHGISRTHLNNALVGRKTLSPAILNTVGLEVADGYQLKRRPP